MTHPVIQTHDLSVHYKRTRALDGLNLSIARGGIHAIIGANGAGKSTLFRVLLGFETPSGGSAAILGCDSARLTPELRARIGYVNEEHTLPGWLRVTELCAMQRRQYARWNEARYHEVLGNFNVAPEQRVSELSRGERAGVNLALALAQSPQLLLLDEPTLGLDVVAKRAFLESLMFCSGSGEATILYCSHQMEEIERVADQLIILERGAVRHRSTPDAFCERIMLWQCQYTGALAALRALPGVLEARRIDDSVRVMVFDQHDQCEERLRQLGAHSIGAMPVSLESAVGGFLASSHIAPATHATQG
ncbi:MAG: ABC transporter ATP-binding protein [Pseudomonadota bacterium]